VFVRQAYKMEVCVEEENEDTNDDDEEGN